MRPGVTGLCHDIFNILVNNVTAPGLMTRNGVRVESEGRDPMSITGTDLGGSLRFSSEGELATKARK